MKLIFQVLINISSHCTNNCNNTCIVYMFHQSQDLQMIATVYILSLAASAPFRSRLFIQNTTSPPPVPINFTPFLHHVMCSTYITGAYFPYLKQEEPLLNPFFRKEFNAGGMYTPVNNVLTPNHFITFVQQRHDSYSYRPKLLQRNRLGLKSFHV